jgi:hypothetical protein
MGNRRKLKECEKDYEIVLDERDAIEKELQDTKLFILRLSCKLADYRDASEHPINQVSTVQRCPQCHERDEDLLVWTVVSGGDSRQCQTCGMIY